jgi:hypothetical protein
MSHKNFSRVFVSKTVLLILVCWALLAVPASAQHFEQVTGALTNVAAGRNEVFGIDSKSAVWRYNASTKSFHKIANAKLGQLVVGGGTLSQLDEVWGIDESLNIYRFNYSSKAFDQIPGTLSQITVGPGYEDNCHPYEVWGVNSAQSIYRYDYCSSEFVQVAGLLTVIATGGGDVWGINVNGQVFHFIFNSFSQVTGLYGTPAQIVVGVNDVWVINESAQVYRYDPSTGQFYGPHDLYLVQIAAGGDGVWATLDGTLARLDPEAGEFIDVNFEGSCTDVAVGSGAGVFAVNSSNQVFMFIRP